MSVSYRVHAIKEGFPDRVVTVSDDGSEVSCDCDGFNEVFRASRHRFCSHIDATLLANERAMVPESDRALADHAANLVNGKLKAPKEWKASWRKNMRWRGISRVRVGLNPRDASKPLVCFTGTLVGKTRKEWIAQAKGNGWEATDEASRFTDVLVAANPSGNSSKLKAARKFNTPIVSADEWEALMMDGVLPT